MKSYIAPAIFLAAILIAGAALFAPSPILHAQQPADQSITRPDRMTVYGDPGGCNEGESSYSILQHFPKRCIAAATQAPIPVLAATSANNGALYSIGATGLPVLLSTGLADSNLTSNTATGLSAARVCHVTYSFAVDGGAATIVPAGNCTLPINAVIYNLGAQATTTVLPSTASIALGCTGGTACGASSLMAATLGSALTAGTFGQSAVLPQTASGWVKTTAATTIQLTVASGPLTAGIVQVFVYYYVSSS